MPGSRTGRAVRVLQGFPEPRSTTNPYITMLYRTLGETDGLEVTTFTWVRALFGRYDVFHSHWPDILLDGRKKLLRKALFAALLVRLRLTRSAIVRTQHNLSARSPGSRLANWLLRRFDRQTAHVVILNEATPVPPGEDATLIPHGHYKDWFARYRTRQRIPGRLGYFGLVRDYKRLGPLITTFRELPQGYTLRIGGRPHDEALAADLRARAGEDPRITLELRFLSDDELVETATESEVVALAYEEMHNSGSALAALSLGRPILVPATEPNQLLSDEVGEGWVMQFSPPLTSRMLIDAVDQSRNLVGEPDLSRRDWDRCGEAHRDVYRAAVARVRPGRWAAMKGERHEGS